MRIDTLLAQKQPFLSLEFFPPKERTQWPGFFDVARQLKSLNPLFCSVTYGAGGSTQHNTLEIVTRMKQEYGLEPLAHLTCVGASATRIRSFLDGLSEGGVRNVLALRGDPPRGTDIFTPDSDEFQYGSDLVAFIHRTYPDLCIGVAGYPEKHPQAVSMEEDLRHLKAKVDAGAHFIITQLFFDNDFYFSFVERTRAVGITVPIVPGILPVQNVPALQRMLSFCGASVPADYLRDLEHAQARYGDSGVRGLGLGYAKAQIANLLDHGAPGVHLYTLNKADTCLEIWKEFSRRITGA
ncbi:MAG: methylenetetrahydrofolate reductase [NAD(P)H] [Desulfovibrionales bacterium]|nr:methylenetetrahydrofolate reductase [NAD(P)H] [Desulfovibrionales bacterium]